MYKAANKAGQTVEGIIEANDQKSVVSALRAKSLYLLNLTEANAKNSMEITIGSAKIPKKVLAVFCTQFASILRAGVPLIQALSIINEQTENRRLKKIVEGVYDDLQRGKGLSDSFSQYDKSLPSIMIKLIEAGEMSGTLDLSLMRLATHFEKEYKLAKKVRSAMMYPAIVSVVTVFVVIFLLIFVVPSFMGFFKNADDLPAITRMLISLSDGIKEGWIYIIGVAFIIFALFRSYKSTQKGKLQLDTLKLRAPVIGKPTVKILAARFCRTLATLTSTGISLTQSLRIASKVVSNKLAEINLLKVEEQIKQGKTLHAAIAATNIFPSMTMHMIKIGEESGKLDEMLEKAAEYFEEEADSAITKMTSLIQPILLIIVAVIIVGIMLAVLMPIFSMYNGV